MRAILEKAFDEIRAAFDALENGIPEDAEPEDVENGDDLPPFLKHWAGAHVGRKPTPIRDRLHEMGYTNVGGPIVKGNGFVYTNVGRFRMGEDGLPFGEPVPYG